MIRRRGNIPQSVVPSNQNVLDWQTQPGSTTAGGSKVQRAATRGGSVANNPLNQTHLSLGGFKKSSLTSSKLGGIQNILNKVPQGATSSKGQGGSVDQKQ